MMGLDICVYSKITPATGADRPFDLHGELNDGFAQFRRGDYPERAPEIENGLAYRADLKFVFRAGSCCGYNIWREQLAKMAGYPPLADTNDIYPHSKSAWGADSGPFWELISFTDCDGVIGSSVAAKLAADFEEYQSVAQQQDLAFWRLYDEFHMAFDVAAKGGAVEFC